MDKNKLNNVLGLIGAAVITLMLSLFVYLALTVGLKCLGVNL